jgi:hypothetical protein
MTQSKTSLEHIDTIIDQINSLIEKKEDFVAFILIALGIEYLGCFFDSAPFNEGGNSGNRFQKGVDLFKNKWYVNNKQCLFKNFRGPLIHQFWTGSEILLTSNCKNNAPLQAHLKLENNKRVFVLEKFFEDFIEAAQSLKYLSQKNNSLNKEKLNQTYSEILTVEMDSTNFACSGKTSSDSIKINFAKIKAQTSKQGQRKKR